MRSLFLCALFVAGMTTAADARRFVGPYSVDYVNPRAGGEHIMIYGGSVSRASRGRSSGYPVTRGHTGSQQTPTIRPGGRPQIR